MIGSTPRRNRSLAFLMVAVASGGGLVGLGACGYQDLQAARATLHDANRAAILAAARVVLAHPDEFRTHPDHPNRHNVLDPTDPKMPQALREIEPREIIVEPGFLTMRFYPGGYHHLELVAFAQPADAERWSGRLGDGEELIPELWYYEDPRE